tara:strand:- start:1832 stop:2620 length:789 start_codon:yes stop_codon:yes gene_type:complete
MADETIAPLRCCTKCGARKPADTDHFRREPRTKIGFQAICLECERARNRARRAADPDVDRRYYLSLSPERKDVYKAAARNRRRDDPGRVREVAAAWRERNREKAREYQRRWAGKNREQERERLRRYFKENRDKIRKRLNEHNREKRKTPHGGLSARVGNLMRHNLRAVSTGRPTNGKRGRSWREFVDYSVEELAAHLERQFARGMSWQNFGEWHIDHIVPVASFNFESPQCPEFRACWSLTNLRPVWAAENFRKNAKRIYLL